MDSKNQILFILNILMILTLISYSVYGIDDNLSSQSSQTAQAKYPGLFSSALRLAIYDSMPSSELMARGNLKITQKQLDDEIKKSPIGLREQYKNNQFFVLEQMAISQLLASEAKVWAESKKINTKTLKESELINKYLTDMTSKITVSTEEANWFFNSNPEMFGGVKFAEIESQLKNYLLNNKKQEFTEAYINDMGKRMTIKVNDSWAKLQYAKALDNPVEKALRSGKPSFINFGATGCIPCEMMAPIREEIKKEYAGKLNVEFINVRENQIMGSRYGISSIPTQVFYDKDGKEVYRHTGFWAKEKVVEKISELGVKK